ncbi:MAG: class I tRNA ligase family protein, partial [Gammaproteobacteria bacterium]
SNAQGGGDEKELRRKLNATIAKVSDDYERRYAFNTAVAANMELVNDIARFPADNPGGRALVNEALGTVVRMLAPIVPHIAQALWEVLGEEGLVMDAAWPEVDKSALVSETIELVVQVNGKLRSRITVAADASRAEIECAAREEPNVARHIEGRSVRRVILVPGRLVNIVIA